MFGNNNNNNNDHVKANDTRNQIIGDFTNMFWYSCITGRSECGMRLVSIKSHHYYYNNYT